MTLDPWSPLVEGEGKARKIISLQQARQVVKDRCLRFLIVDIIALAKVNETVQDVQ